MINPYCVHIIYHLPHLPPTPPNLADVVRYSRDDIQVQYNAILCIMRVDSKPRLLCILSGIRIIIIIYNI